MGAVLSPADGIMNILRDPALNLTTGWQFAVGRLSSTPNAQIVARNTGGREPELAVAIDYPTVQLLCRGDKNKYSEAWAKINACKEALTGIPSAPANYTDLTSCIPMGDIVDLGYDDNDRPQFALNFRLIISFDSSGYREPL